MVTIRLLLLILMPAFNESAFPPLFLSITVSLLKEDLAKLGNEHPLWGGHGMMWETSIVMAMNRNWTDLSRVDSIKASPLSHQLRAQPVENLNAIKEANGDFGNEYLDLAAARLAHIFAPGMVPFSKAISWSFRLIDNPLFP